MNEAEFQSGVIEYARLRGWMVHAERPARTKSGWVTPIQGDAGWPDLVLTRGGRLLFIELKGARGKVSEAQAVWHSALRLTGHPVLVWRPDDWPEIERVLL